MSFSLDDDSQVPSVQQHSAPAGRSDLSSVNLEFQGFVDFDASKVSQVAAGAVAGAMAASIAAGSRPDPNAPFPGEAHPQQDSQQQPQQPQGPPQPTHFWQVAHYRPYFDVDTKDVLMRVLRSLIPFKGDFIQQCGDKPDLYGPFWIATTLIAAVAISSNLASYLAFRRANGVDSTDSSSTHWVYSFDNVYMAAIGMYGYLFGLPLLLFFVFKWKSVKLSLIDTICILGYSFFVFIPVCALSIIGSEIMRWVLIGVTFLTSTMFLLLNVYSVFKQSPELTTGWSLGLISTIGVLHAAMCLFLRLYFFSFAT